MKPDSEILLSIIMPVYNAAEFLVPTLNSVFPSAGSDTELIAVDDGSNDASPEILASYQERYPNLIILRQENSGPSAARNNALSIARGEFIFFLDSDDLVEYSVLHDMCLKAGAQSADLIIAKYDIFNEYRKMSVSSIRRLSSMETIKWNDTGILWTFALWNKLFRRDKIEELQLRFPDTSYSEDGVFVMNYVYHSSKILGHSSIVLHYRRMVNSAYKSITSTVGPAKILDYLRSHDMIYDAMCRKFLNEEGYTDIDALRADNEEVNKYVNEFLKKEITILINQFYKMFWTLDPETISILTDNIRCLLEKTDLRTYYTIAADHPELPLGRLFTSWTDAGINARVAVLLYDSPENKEDFLICLNSLLVQVFIPYQIIVPESMRSIVEELDMPHHQVVYIQAQSCEEFLEVIPDLTASWVLVADSHFIYEKSGLAQMYKNCINMHLDYLTTTIYILNDNLTFPCSRQGRCVLRNKNYRSGSNLMTGDGFLANKMISTTYLQQVYRPGSSITDLAFGVTRQGYFATSQKCCVIFHGKDEEHLDILMEAEISAIPDDLESIRLDSPRFDTDELEVYKKLRLSYKKKNAWKRKLINMMTHLPLRNRVLIFSIRRDDSLDENLQYIEKYITCSKVIITHTLPHTSAFKMKMYYYAATSRVILTDDYVRYLRLFPLKKGQRVVQLWHACGAFKKFGIQGTNLSLGVERATHIQYNMVSVSAEYIRSIYARAFDIDVKNIVALGVPRTDLFFNTEEIEQRKNRIYSHYPDWHEKEILLYAPTFRDKTGDRTIFKPEIDFDRLSGQLLENQIFVIAPHPVMKHPVLDKTYDNIIEVRDIRTIDLMLVSHILITDYSSVIFEYSLLQKPILFFCYDLEMYDRGFYLSYDSDLPGEIVRTQDELAQSLTSENRHLLKDNYTEFTEKYMGACDGNSSRRIADIILRYMEGHHE